VSETRRVLRIEPHSGRGDFAIWLNGELKATGSRAEVEEAVGRWQADLDAGREPDWSIGGLMIDEDARVEIETLRAEIETLRTAITPAPPAV
jgi:hypothetical protein